MLARARRPAGCPGDRWQLGLNRRLPPESPGFSLVKPLQLVPVDRLDSILLEAWNRIGEAVRQDRIKAFKRSQRRFRSVFTRPMREWCLVIRASDTRINEHTAIIEPRGVREGNIGTSEQIR